MPEEMDLEEDTEKDTTSDTDMEDEELEEAEEAEDANEEESEEKEEPKSHKGKKKWYASAWFWVVIACVIVIAGALIWFFGFYSPEKSTQDAETAAEKALASDWSDLVDETNTFAKQTAEVKTVDDFPALSKDADQITEIINRSKDRYKNQDSVQSSDYQSALENVNAYTLSLQALLDKDYTKITTNDFDSLKTLAADAKTAADTFSNNATYIKEGIGNDFFNTSIAVKTIYDAKIVEDQAASEAEKEAQQKEAAKLAQEQEDVNTAVTGFMDAYIAGDKTEIKNFMTADFQKEFDLDKLDNAYYDPTNYRIIDTVKNSDTRYYVYGRLTEKTAGYGSDQYAYDYNFTVVLNGGSWLVDIDQAPSR